MSTFSSLFAPEAFMAVRTHPGFSSAIAAHARRNLAHYAACNLLERWLMSDLGRAALSGAAMILDAVPGGLSRTSLLAAAAANRTCSRGRAVGYLDRCELEGFFVPAAPGDAASEGQLLLTARFLRPMLGAMISLVEAVTELAPAVAPAIARLADLEDAAFRRRFLGWLASLTVSRPDLFNGPDMPVVLFLNRDGGGRMLEQLLLSQPPGGERLLDSAPLSRSALARASFASRTHVARLLADGEDQGLLAATGDHIRFSPRLSDDVERHYAHIFEVARVSALMALKDG